MEFRVLGPITVIGADGVTLDLGTSQQRAVLALCLLAAPRPVSASRIIDALWGEDPPPSALNTVQSYVSKLRRVLEPDRVRRGAASILVSGPGGYAVDVPAEQVDRRRAAARAAEGRRLLAEGDPTRAARQLRLALSEWRGDPLTGFEGQPWAEEEQPALAELRLAIVEDAAEAELALGRGAELVSELARLVAAYPTRERLRRLGAHALYQGGRQADALALLAEGRRLLVGELGLDPDPRSRELESRILAQDPGLIPTPASPVPEPAGPGGVIGRDAETAQLRRAVERPGHRVALVAGEPGIGKTSLVEEVAWSVPDQRVAFGRCWDGGGAPPFWPWVQALRELTGRDGELTEITGATGEFPMYEAVARLLNGGGPVLVVLDDLQWADASSLRLLEFLAATRACPDLTVLATYRDTEVGEPLARALAALSRLPHVERVTLGGLSEEAVAEYLARSGADPALAAREHRQTGGNPFYLGLLGSGEQTPGAVADVLRGRLAALPPGAHDVLSTAALIGRETELGVLLDVLDVLGLPRDQVLDVLDAAVRARLLTERSLSYAFSHDIVREVLRDGLAPLRRRRMHAQVAAVLERRGTHLAELAYHYREGLVISGMAAKAIDYARQAARHACDQFAYEDAAAHLASAAELTGQLPVTDLALRCDLLIELAEALAAAGLNSRVHAVLDEAAALADTLGDGERLARAALGFADPLLWAMYEEWTASEALVARIDLALRDDAGDRWRSPLLAASAIMGAFTRPLAESRELAARAVTEATDDRALLRALSATEILSRGLASTTERQAIIARMAEAARATGDLVDDWLAREAAYVELVAEGRLTEADPILSWLRETATELRQPALIGLATWQAAIRAYLAGDLDTAIAEADQAARIHPDGALGQNGPRLRALLMRALSARLHGAPAEALTLITQATTDPTDKTTTAHGATTTLADGATTTLTDGATTAHGVTAALVGGATTTLADGAMAALADQPAWTILRCHVLLDLGHIDQARKLFATFSEDGFAGIDGDLTYRFIPDTLTQICHTLADRTAAEALYTRLLPNTGRLLGWSITDLCLSRLAETLNRPADAARHRAAALDFINRAGLPQP
ncbi:BTAD domain-containing putative transcriptional regulator [Acrocarpospora catenulata]|uniref:BTAD domain-containing putative transcriptional regulator n=1 Tax=Acrocarpospora catenulata TaxID=2836182 RepID=UPI001BDAAEB9|nr:BTAD domain-containing putative transcriptional regulator [Acrocarpospora catenulata]